MEPTSFQVADDLCFQSDTFSSGRDAHEREQIEPFRRSLARFCRESVDGLAIDAAGARPPQILDGLRQLGMTGLMVPPRHGGAGLSPSAAATLVSELARFDLSVATTTAVHNGLALWTLLTEGSEEQQERFLPGIASGEDMAAFAVTEPNAGSDLVSTATRADLAGDELTLNGEKCFITNAGFARFAAVLAQTSRSSLGPFCLLFVDLTTPGVSRGPEEHKMGLKGSSTAGLQFTDVKVPVANILGKPGFGLQLVQRALCCGRTLLAAGCAGGARASIDIARAHAKARRVRGRPLLELPAVRQHVALAEAQCDALESVVKAAATSLCAGREPTWISSVAKVACSTLAWEICDRMIQIHGGAGYMEPAGLARRLRDLRVARIFEGPNDVVCATLAARLMGQLGTGNPPERLVDRCSEPLRAPASSIDRVTQRLYDAIVSLLEEHGMMLVRDRQMDGLRLAEAAVWIQSAAILVSRRQVEISATSEDEPALLRCQIYVDDAVRRASALLDQIGSAVDGWAGAAIR